MSRSPLIRLLAAAMCGGVAALGLLVALSFVNAESGFAQTTAAAHFGWLVPLLTGIATGGLAWGLLHARDPDLPKDLSATRSCEQCGGIVMGDWRLCPHCGYRFPDSSR